MPRSRRTTFAVLALLAAGIAAVAIYAWLSARLPKGPHMPGDQPTALRVLIPPFLLPSDQDDIAAEIQRRAAIARAGEPLPGTPALGNLTQRLAAQGLVRGAPVFIRIFKREFELEVWMRKGDRFERFATYPVCNWSGTLGPKLAEGDGQSPEGFYTVDARQLNPKSNYHRAFNLGFPNAFDRAQGRTGSFLMVHGACASIGCYAMTNPVIEEIWDLVTAALKNGQKRFHVHVFPFRLSPDNLIRYREERPMEFWRELKVGYDAFETAKLPPSISVCDGHYAVAIASPNSAGSDEISERCVTR